MYLLVAAQQTSTVKFAAFFFRFQSKDYDVRVNKSDNTA